MLTEGSLLGLSTGTHCACFCIPIFIGFSSRNISNHTPLSNMLLFLGGRFIAYLTIGCIFSFIGMRLSITYYWTALINFVIGLFLIIWGTKGFNETGSQNFCCNRKRSFLLFPFIAGILTGGTPCPPFLAGIARVLSTENVLAGGIFFVGFYVTTSIFILPGLISWLIKYKIELKYIASFVSIIYGLIFISLGISKLSHGLLMGKF